MNRETVLLCANIKRVVERLTALLPDLEYSRQTHVDWRDCESKYRVANPDIGDAEFHAQCVREYDERIGAIREAIDLLSEIPPN
jgi:hypothetical protein